MIFCKITLNWWEFLKTQFISFILDWHTKLIEGCCPSDVMDMLFFLLNDRVSEYIMQFVLRHIDKPCVCRSRNGCS